MGIIPMGFELEPLPGIGIELGIAAGVPGVLATGLLGLPPPQPALTAIKASSPYQNPRDDMRHLLQKLLPSRRF